MHDVDSDTRLVADPGAPFPAAGAPSALAPTTVVVAATVILTVLASCTPPPPPDLPGEEDLYAYAKAVASRARSLVPEDDDLGLFHVGRAQQLFGYEDDALAIYARVARLAPTFATVHMQVGYIMAQRSDRLNDAIAAYRRALDVDPAVPGAHTRLGLIYLHENKLDDAERELREEIRRGTADATSRYTLGQALALAKGHEEAVREFRSALELDPNMRMAHYALAQSLVALGRSEESQTALAQYRELKQVEDDLTQDFAPGSSNRASQLQWTCEVWMNAADLFARGMQRTTDPVRLRQLDGEYRRALREAARFGPYEMGPHMALMLYHDSRGEVDLAAAACEQLLKVYANKDVVLDAYRLAGLCLEGVTRGDQTASGRVDQAQRILERIVELAPAMADAHRELARLLIVHRAERPDLLPVAVDHARMAVEARPTARNYDVLAVALLSSGKIQEAKEKLEEGVRANPEDRTLQDRLSSLLERYRL